MMSEHQKRVNDLMSKIGQELPASPTIPSEKVRILRAKLILEEAFETVAALGISVHGSTEHLGGFVIAGTRGLSIDLDFEVSHDPNLVEIVDGCCDMNVISAGTLLACGVQDQEPQRLVDQSNLNKFEPPTCPTCKEPGMVYDDYKRRWYCYKNCPISLSPDAGPYLRDDGKWIKPPYWVAPDLKTEIERQEKNVKNENFAANYSTWANPISFSGGEAVNFDFSGTYDVNKPENLFFYDDQATKIQPIGIIPRKVHEVLDRIIEQIPVTALVTKIRFKAVRTSAGYCAPEDIGRIWQEGQSLINELTSKLEETSWGKKVLGIWSNNE